MSIMHQNSSQKWRTITVVSMKFYTTKEKAITQKTNNALCSFPPTKMKSLTILLLSISILQSSVKCSAAFSKMNENEANLIQKTCKQTDYYKLCISALESDPRSSKADIKELALISAELVLLKANGTLWHVGELFRKVRDPVLYRLYGTCIEEYRAIVERQMPEAIAALKSGEYWTSKNDAEATATHAQNCEEQFAGESQPFTDQNRAVHDLSLVTSSIIEILG